MISGNQIPKITQYSGSPAAAGNTSGTIFTTSTRCKFAVLKISWAANTSGSFIWKTSNAIANFLAGCTNTTITTAASGYAEVTLPANTAVGYFSNNTNQLAFSITVEEYF